MGSPWSQLPVALPSSDQTGATTATSAPSSIWSALPTAGANTPNTTGSTDPNKPYNPYTYLKSVPSQVGADQIDGLHPQFASKFAEFSREALQMFPGFQLSAGYDKTGKRHTQNSWHYKGQAADVVPDWNFSNSPEDVAKLQNLAQKHGLSMLNEWVGGGKNSTPNSHIHISLPGVLPKGNQPFAETTGRVRTSQQVEQFARSYAIQKGVDPDVVSNLLRTTTNYTPDHVGQDYTFGMAKLPQEIIQKYLPKNATMKDYLNNSSIQVRVAVDRLADLVKPGNGTGDYGTALALYQGLPEGGDSSIARAKAAFVSSVLGVSTKEAPSYVAGGRAPYDYDVQKSKESRELGGDPGYTGAVKQTYRNFAEGGAQTILDATSALPKYGGYLGAPKPETLADQAGPRLSAGISANPAYSRPGGLYGNNDLVSPQDKINQAFLPHLSFNDAFAPNGTVDDKHWAVDSVKQSLNHVLLYTPGLISASLRPSKDFEQQRKNLVSTWAGSLGLGVLDFATSLPAMLLATEYALPAVMSGIGIAGRGALAAAGSASRAVGLTRVGSTVLDTAGSALSKIMTPILDMLPQYGGAQGLGAIPGAVARNAAESWPAYLIKNGLFEKVIPIAGYEGLAAFNKELQRQFDANIPFGKAWPSAFAAMRQNAASTFLLMAALPGFGLPALALFKGAAAKGGGAVDDLIAKMRAGQTFGDKGPIAAKVLDTMWERTPGKDLMAGFVQRTAETMKSADKDWIYALAKGSYDALAKVQHLAANETAHAAAIDALGDTKQWAQTLRRNFQNSVDVARKAPNKLQSQITALETEMSGFAQRDPHGIIPRYLAAEQELNQFKSYVTSGKGPSGGPLVDANNKATAEGTQVAKRIADLQREMQDMQNLPVSKPLFGAAANRANTAAQNPGSEGYWLNGFLRARGKLDGTGEPGGIGLRQKLVQANGNPLIIDPTVQTTMETLQFFEDNAAALQRSFSEAMNSGSIPDHAAALKTAPSIYGPLTKGQQEEYDLMQARLKDFSDLATPSATGTYRPMVQSELQRQVELSLVNVAGGGALENSAQYQTAGNILGALHNMKAKSSNAGVTRTLEDAIRTMENFYERITGNEAPKYQRNAATRRMEPVVSAVPKPRGVGAVDMSQSRVQELVEGKAEDPSNTIYTRGVPEPSDTIIDRINKLMGIKSAAFPNGLPIGALAEKGLQYAVNDPTTMKITADALSQMGAVMASEEATTTSSVVRRLLEETALGKITPGIGGDKYDLVDRFSQYNVGIKDAMRVLLKNRAATLDTVDRVFGASQYFANTMMGVEKASLLLADKVRKEWTSRLPEVLGLKKGQSLSKEFQTEFAQAVQGGPDELVRFLNQTHTFNGKPMKGSDFIPGLNLFLDVQTALERFKAQSPEMASLFRANYFLQQHPRLITFIERGSDDVKRIAQSLSSERKRSIENIKLAIERGKAAMEGETGPDGLRIPGVIELSEQAGIRPIKTWEEFIYGFKNPNERLEALGFDPSDRVGGQRVTQWMKDVLLGDPTTDPGEVLHNIVHSTFRADSIRNLMAQFRTMNGPEGLPLLIHTTDPQLSGKIVNDTVDARVRTWAFGKVQDSVYQNLDTVPGLAGYYARDAVNGEGKWLIHPQAANLMNKYLIAPKDEASGFWNKAGMVAWRSLCLIGAPFNYLYSLMSNYTTMVGFNMAKAYGFIPLGEKVAEDPSIMMLRAIGAGLQPASLLRNATIISDDLLQTAKLSPDIQKAKAMAYGDSSTPFIRLMEKTGGAFNSLKVLNPISWLEGADNFLNRVGLFNALSHAQLGAWTYYTGQIMENQGAKLLAETGGRYSAALALAEKQAAAHVNRLAGVLPYHMMSDTMRKTMYGIALAPQYAASKWDSIIEAVDGVIGLAQGRSRYAFTPSDTLQALNKKQIGSFLVGGALNSVIYSNALSYFLNGHSTFANPEGHEFDIRIGKDTYISNPMFGMFRGLMKGVGAFALHGETEKAMGFLMGQLHPAFQTIYSIAHNKDEMTGAPVMPKDAMTTEWWRAAFRQAVQHTFNLGDFGYREGVAPPGKGIFGSQVGVPMTWKEYALQLLGTNPTKALPLEMYEASKINAGLAYAKNQMQDQLRVRLQLASQYPPDSPEAFEIYKDAIKFATQEGVPVGDRALTAYFKMNLHPKGNYVMQDPEDLMDAIDMSLNPNKAAFNKTPQVLRPLLYKKIEEDTHAQILGFLEKNMDKVTPGDVMAERMRRLNGYDVPQLPKPAPYMDFGAERRLTRQGKEAGVYTPSVPMLAQPTLNPLRQLEEVGNKRSKKPLKI